MTDDSGILSVDFLVGFTIFMVAFIWVATLVPNLFLGVSSHGVDFDAVAYRTGVILAEDPGATEQIVTTPWEFQPDTLTANSSIARFGLAVSKETPNILSEAKINSFFNKNRYRYPFVYNDYRNKIIFGDYPYRFNVSLSVAGENTTDYVGDVLPGTDTGLVSGSNYGYIRREVKVKHFSNATIDPTDYQKFKMTNGDDKYGNVTFNEFSIMINADKLVNGNITDPVTNPNYKAAYQIDPLHDKIIINITDLDKIPPRPVWSAIGGSGPTPNINLTKVTFWTGSPYGGLAGIPAGQVPHLNFTYDDGNSTPVNLPVTLKQNVTFIFEPGFFVAANSRGAIYINLTFGVDEYAQDLPLGPRNQGMQFLNNTRTGPWDYNYNVTEVTQPVLRDAVMEVAVW
jgi:hypothetical protein